MKRRFLSLCLALVLCLGLGTTLLPAKATTGGKLIALTFDDGPAADTSRLLDGLNARGVHCTFFMVGQSVNRYIDVVSRLYQDGHQVANHSYSHANLIKLSQDKVAEQIQSTNRLLDQACGAGTQYQVRAPYGNTNAQVRATIGVPLIYWAIDPLDWKDRNATIVRDRVVNGAYDGAIILLHDSHPTSVDGALMAIDILQQQGYEFVTVREMYRRRGVAMENGVSHVQCKPTGVDYGHVADPVFSSRMVGDKLEVTIQSQGGAGIWYSTDGSNIIQTSTQYTGPFLVDPPCTVKAVAAFNLNGDRSNTVTQEFNLKATLPPTLTVTDNTLTIESNTPGASLFYTLDGTPAGPSSTPYTGPVTLEPGTVVNACAAGGGFYTSDSSRVVLSRGGNVLQDVLPSDWYADAVDAALASGIMNGAGGYEFAPNRMITRGEFLTALFRADTKEYSEKQLAKMRKQCPFTDVPEGSFYQDAVAWAYRLELVGGDGAGNVMPDASITRQEIAKILASYLDAKGKQLTADDAASGFTDSGAIAPWAADSVNAVVSCGLMQGSDENAFTPTEGATRAQAASVLTRLGATMESLPTRPGAPLEELLGDIAQFFRPDSDPAAGDPDRDLLRDAETPAGQDVPAEA